MKRKSARGIGILLVIGTIIVIAVSCGISSNSSQNGPSSTTDSTGHSVVYSVTGSAASASVDYVKDDNLGQAQKDIHLPWSTTVDMGAGIFGASLEVQNKGGSGSVTCTIKDNGKVVSTTTSSGAYVVATCSG